MRTSPGSAAPWRTCGLARWPTGCGCSSAGRLRLFPGAARRVLPGPDPSAAAGWPEGYRPVDALTPDRWPGLPELRAGKITLLGVTRELGDESGWEHADAPRLWRFHLYYWDWAWGLAADPDRPAARAMFAGLWRSWQASAAFGRGEAWHPYPAALRAWSWCGLHRDLVAGSEIETGLRRRARRPRRVPAPPPGKRCRRQPPDQEPQGARRPRRVLRRRAAARRALRRLTGSWPFRCCPTAVTTSARPRTTARCLPTSSTSPACCGPPGAPAGRADRGDRRDARLARARAHPRRPGPAAQ